MGCSLANHYTSQLKMYCTNWQSVKNTRVLGLCFVVLQKANALKSVEGHFTLEADGVVDLKFLGS